jgi:ribosomal protein S18 acetylase RimI-like enzyme
MNSQRPFSADSYTLGTRAHAICLRTVNHIEAADMGRAFAAMEPWSRYPFPPEALTAYFATSEPHAPRFVIEAGGDVAGAIGIRTELLRGPYLQFLGLLPAFQGRGIGVAILDWIEVEAGPSTRNFWVCASVSNEAAIRFYERHGFQRVAVLDGLVQDGFDELLLRKRLK